MKESGGEREEEDKRKGGNGQESAVPDSTSSLRSSGDETKEDPWQHQHDELNITAEINKPVALLHEETTELAEDDDIPARVRARKVGLEATFLWNDLSIAKAMAAPTSTRSSEALANASSAAPATSTSTSATDNSYDSNVYKIGDGSVDKQDEEAKNKAEIVELPPSRESPNKYHVCTSTSPSDTQGQGKANATEAVETASTSSRGSENATETPNINFRPGAYRVYPTASSSDTQGQVDENAPSTSSRGSEHAMVAEIYPAPNITEAYTVDDTLPPRATVVKTIMGVDQKRFIQFVSCGSVMLVAVVLGISIPFSRRNQSSSSSNTCGPLCGQGNEVPHPEKEVFGKTCRQHDDFSRIILIQPEDKAQTCTTQYATVAHGCGCPGSLGNAPSSVCGKLCSDGSHLPDPDLVVSDYNQNSHTCRDWESLALFDSDSNECPLYNAIGHLCGCSSNEPHPESCGPLCQDGGFELMQEGEQFEVWGTSCNSWDTFSLYLPIWYNNENGESCEEFYESIQYGCACSGTRSKGMGRNCGHLCQELRTCGPLCSDGSAVPKENKDKLIKLDTCDSWEYAARYEVHEFICPQYHQFGAMCGCDNKKHSDNWSRTCGTFCGENLEDVPNPNKVVLGKTCELWHYEAKYLPFHNAERANVIVSFDTCTNLKRIEYECGCDAPKPPEKSCGKLCPDGSDLPEPDKEVGGRTCSDWEFLSIFDERLDRCEYQYGGVSEVCGCTNSLQEAPCFRVEQLYEKKWFFVDSSEFQYKITFGSEGLFSQQHLWLSSDEKRDIVVGYSQSTEYSNFTKGDAIRFTEGNPCGVFGTRVGTVDFVEDAQATSPTIVSMNEPALCRYVAVMHVPMFCTEDDGL